MATTTENGSINMKLEVIVVPVSDVDRAKAFYERLGWRLDIDFVASSGRRVVQFTPPGSEASIHIGREITSATPGSLQNVYLVVSDVEKARADLLARGVPVSEVFHFDGLLGPQVSGPDPKRGSYGSFASFKDPDGNGWLLQEITTRLPGREWKSTGEEMIDVKALAALLREAELHHGQYEKTHPKHNWWDWYAPYLNAREKGCNPDESVAAAAQYMDEIRRPDSR